MANDIAVVKVKIDTEMTETSKQVLRQELIKLLSEPEVLKVLLEELEKRLLLDIRKMIRD